MLKIGLLGAGHLGRIHLKCLQLAKESFDLVGFYEPDEANARRAIDTFGVHRFATYEDLLAAVEVVDIVTPTVTHFELAKQALLAGKHIFIEKPITQTAAEARDLRDLQRDSGLHVQIGHVERFNPALLAIDGMTLDPMFIEAHRLAPFNPRSTDVSVVLDLMIHDLDLLLSMVDSEVVDIQANGVAIVSHSADIANARLQFANGCVANLTASRISLKQMRKLRLFQSDAYVSLDFLEKTAQVVRLHDADGVDPAQAENWMPLETQRGKKLIEVLQPDIEPTNAIQRELESFAASIVADEFPKVTLEDGYRALQLAQRILSALEG